MDGSTSPELLHGVNYKKLHGDASWSPHHFINRQVDILPPTFSHPHSPTHTGTNTLSLSISGTALHHSLTTQSHTHSRANTLSQVELHIQRLLRAGYKCVLFIEVDEMIVTDTKQYPLGLKQYMKEFVEDATRNHVRVIG